MLQLMLQLLRLLHGDSSLDDDDAELSGVYQPDSDEQFFDAVYSFGTPAQNDSHQSLLQHQHAPDLRLLLLASLVVLALGYPTFAWLSRHLWVVCVCACTFCCVLVLDCRRHQLVLTHPPVLL
jgi:hypothetical protein